MLSSAPTRNCRRMKRRRFSCTSPKRYLVTLRSQPFAKSLPAWPCERIAVADARVRYNDSHNDGYIRVRKRGNNGVKRIQSPCQRIASKGIRPSELPVVDIFCCAEDFRALAWRALIGARLDACLSVRDVNAIITAMYARRLSNCLYLVL